jgi:hypothetical protein
MKNIIFAVLGGFIMLTACDQPEQIGPSVKEIYGPLSVTTPFAVSNSNPNFSTGATIYFTAKFANTTSWTITITGPTSGATKTISGISKDINSTNSKWDGTANSVPSFKVGEVATATLTFANSSTVYTKTITIAGVKDLDADGVIVTDFGGTPTQISSWESDWPASVTTNTTYSQPDGNAYMYMSGTPWQGGPPVNSPYVDFISILPSQSDIDYGAYFPLYADASKVFFNIMVYGNGASSNNWLKVILHEDGGNSRSIDIRPDWTGWKLLSYNYKSDFLSTSTAIPMPNRITSVQLVLLSESKVLPGPAVNVAFDHIIFTHNKPYQP